MKQDWDELHTHILCLLHALVYGGYGLSGDASERLLRQWYAEYAPLTVSTAECCAKDSARFGSGSK